MIMISLVALLSLFQSGETSDPDTVHVIVASGDYAFSSEDYSSMFGPEYSLARSISWLFDATSELESQGNYDYLVTNLNDVDRTTAWVEGVPGNGEGEVITTVFYDSRGQEGVPCWGISIMNGYSRNQTVWENNSRVHLLEVRHNGDFLFYIELEDTMQHQSAYWHDDVIQLYSGDTLEFEIISTYPGTTYSDTAITELVFHGGGQQTNN